MRSIVLLSVCLATIGMTTVSGGGAIVLTPTTIVMGPADTAASVSVRNDTSQPVGFRVKPLLWRNSETGEMQVESTDDLMVFPETVTLNPGESRRIRLGSRSPRDARQAAERSYRLLLESLPEPVSTSTAGEPSIKTRLQFSLPVFLQPKDRTVRVDMPPPTMDGGLARLALSNRGALHVTPTKVELTGLDRSGKVVWTRALRTWYLLPGENRHYAAAVSPAECRQTSVVAAESTFAEDARLTLREKWTVASDVCAVR